MSASEPLAVTVAPLFIRLALAVTFIWAGSIKVFYSMAVPPAQAAALAQMGLSLPTARAGTAPAAATPGPAAPAPAAPSTPLPVPRNQSGSKNGASAPATEPRGATFAAAQTSAGVPGGVAATAAEPVGPVEVRRVYAIALMVQSAANPPVKDGHAAMPMWPAKAATGSWPLVFAWAAAATELVGGVMVLVGLFTRLWCLGLAFTMLVALWLTQIGPVVQAGSGVLGFLPAYPVTDAQAWMPVLWPFSLLMLALAGVFAGSGALSVDRTVLGPASGKKGG